ncbi:hypothetical protein ALQ39_200070 [Pseudomonas amygdali pv. eriobotryae]|uniref:Uncharacterized protein n=1 Tax=Pseudomonas amygdali pv. eriobotryae TaxID=129137 RepID=A0A3M3VXA5_PSEA0|nr:hypothetical protein ALQ39_200070 [Pseudomonas amygdali pv. eriobotryae]RMR65298.1 hypothetical protein ALP80_200205 [Pseudomonas savastanoi pv. fraxini]
MSGPGGAPGRDASLRLMHYGLRIDANNVGRERG